MADSDKEPHKEIDAEPASPESAAAKDAPGDAAATPDESAAEVESEIEESFSFPRGPRDYSFGVSTETAAAESSADESAGENSADAPSQETESMTALPNVAESNAAEVVAPESPTADNVHSAGSIIHDPATPPQQHHVSNILDEVMEEPAETEIPRRFKHPMWLDLVLAIGLLVAMGGFAIGLFKIYLTHTAEQCITQGNYKVAIALLRGAPFPGLFVFPGSDADELLNQAMYQDAMDRIDSDNDVENALKELQQIRATSKYFTLAQEFIKDNFEPSSTTLKGSVETQGKAVPEKKPLLPPAPQDASP